MTFDLPELRLKQPERNFNPTHWLVCIARLARLWKAHLNHCLITREPEIGKYLWDAQ
jgi:hypothetical protein